VVLSPLEKWVKLKELMAPSKSNRYGRSGNAVSQEVDVYLATLNDFLKSGGAPTKYDAANRQYQTEPLNKLAEWIDTQSLHDPHGEREKRKVDATKELKRSKSRHRRDQATPEVRPKTPPAADAPPSFDSPQESLTSRISSTPLTPAADTPPAFDSPQKSLFMCGDDGRYPGVSLEAEKAPSPIMSDFLSSVDPKFCSTQYLRALQVLGVTRPGQLQDMSLSQLVGASIKKLHARRIKTNPAVCIDAGEMVSQNDE
jgi:hypothetical protein